MEIEAIDRLESIIRAHESEADYARQREQRLKYALEYACRDNTPERCVLRSEERIREAIEWADKQQQLCAKPSGNKS